MAANGFSYRGVIPILPTPFTENEGLDLESLARLVDFAAATETDGVTVLGVLGEANALTDAEGAQVVRAAVAAARALPVVVGASRPGVRATRAVIEVAAAEGAHAAMVAPPSFDGMPEAKIFGYFAAVAQDSPIPIVVQDHPASTRMHMSTDLLARLIEEIEVVAGLKCESVPTAAKLRAVKARTTRVPVMTGLGAVYAGFDLRAGSDGFNTGFAFPEFLVALNRRAAVGDWTGVDELYQRFLPLLVFEQQPGPAIRKEIWRRRAVLASSQVRAPIGQVDDWTSSVLAELLTDTFGDADITKAIHVV